MSLHDLSDFFSLSRALNYSLQDTAQGRFFILTYLVNKQPFESRSDRNLVLKAIDYIIDAYGKMSRRVGPPAVLHPLRATALLIRTTGRVNVVDILTTLFHDLLEDISPLKQTNHLRVSQEHDLISLLDALPTEDAQTVQDRLKYLTKKPSENYYTYIGRIMDAGPMTADLLRIKMADRLDNTLDMRMDLQEAFDDTDFYQTLFETLFVSCFNQCPTTEWEHPFPSPLNGSKRLFQLFKNSVLLTLIRRNLHTKPLEKEAQILFYAIAEASLREAQRSFLHITRFHLQDISRQRELVMEAMDYCYHGGIKQATLPKHHSRLDGLFKEYFGHADKAQKKRRLDLLYKDKPLMLQTTIAFAVIFKNFIRDEQFYIRGIGIEGIEAH